MRWRKLRLARRTRWAIGAWGSESVCLSLFPSISLWSVSSVHLCFLYPSIHPSGLSCCPSIYPCIIMYLAVHHSAISSVDPAIHLFIHPFNHPSNCLIDPSIHVSLTLIMLEPLSRNIDKEEQKKRKRRIDDNLFGEKKHSQIFKKHVCNIFWNLSNAFD